MSSTSVVNLTLQRFFCEKHNKGINFKHTNIYVCVSNITWAELHAAKGGILKRLCHFTGLVKNLKPVVLLRNNITY